jgi:predicted DNA-binding WGR domain protein
MKLTDIAPYNELGKPILHVYLEFVGTNDKNVSGKSNKFWEAAVFARGARFVFVRRWGKYGKKGQLKEQEHYSTWSAQDALLEVKQKKRAKGYTKEIDVITRLGTLVEGD